MFPSNEGCSGTTVGEEGKRDLRQSKRQNGPIQALDHRSGLEKNTNMIRKQRRDGYYIVVLLLSKCSKSAEVSSNHEDIVLDSFLMKWCIRAKSDKNAFWCTRHLMEKNVSTCIYVCVSKNI